MKGFSVLVLVAFAALVILVNAKVNHVPSYLRNVGNFSEWFFFEYKYQKLKKNLFVRIQ